MSGRRCGQKGGCLSVWHGVYMLSGVMRCVYAVLVLHCLVLSCIASLPYCLTRPHSPYHPISSRIIRSMPCLFQRPIHVLLNVCPDTDPIFGMSASPILECFRVIHAIPEAQGGSKEGPKMAPKPPPKHPPNPYTSCRIHVPDTKVARYF